MHLKNFKAGIFDIGGVLQNQDAVSPFVRDVAQTFAVSEQKVEEVRKKIDNLSLRGEIDEEKYWRRFRMELGTDIPLPDDLFLRSYRPGFSINPDVLSTIKKLKSQGLKLACLTDTHKPHTEFNKTQGLYDLFDIQIFSHDVHLRKPDPQIYKVCLKKLGVDAENVFFVDDKERNLPPANKLGITTILFINAKQLKDELQKLGVLA